MRILIEGLNFAPEPTSTGHYTGAMAHWLGGRGHAVRAVAAPPYYPAWRVGDGYSAWRYRLEEAPPAADGVEVIRCPLYVPRRANGARRLAHLFSYAASSAPACIAGARWRPDVVVAVAPTLFALPGAWLGARLAGAPLWLHVQDFELDAAHGTGLLTSGWVGKPAERWERWCLRRCERVSTISEPMLRRLAAKDVDAKRCIFLPNWADTTTVYPLKRASTLRGELSLEPEARVALYAGNMGEKQGLELVLDAARRLSDRDDVLFVLAGDGATRQRLEVQSRDMFNVVWLPVQPSERLNELLNLADVHLLPQRADVAGVVMPSKLTNMLASGRPVVATAGPEMAIHDVVAGYETGVVVAPGDVDGFAEAIRRLISDEAERGRLGRNGRAYAEKYLNKDRILTQFEQDLVACVAAYRKEKGKQADPAD